MGVMGTALSIAQIISIVAPNVQRVLTIIHNEDGTQDVIVHVRKGREDLKDALAEINSILGNKA